MTTTLGGRYRLDERIGSGGMAVVWRGYDLVLERTVAVKMMDSALAADSRAGAQARKEALAAARLSHPNVAAVYDFGESRRGLRAAHPYIVMEFVDGETLQERLRRDGALHWRVAAAIGAQVAAALTAAHEHGMVHRDVKPGNVMLTAAGVKVVDFGIAAAIGQAQTNTAGIMLGTPLYMAPEQIRGEPVLPASDIYALGLVLYECLTGHVPWPDGSPSEIALARGDNLLPAPLPAIDGLPDALAELCRRCLDDAPDRRPPGLHAARLLAEQAGVEPALAYTGPDGPGGPLPSSAPADATASAHPPVPDATASAHPPVPAGPWTTRDLKAHTVASGPRSLPTDRRDGNGRATGSRGERRTRGSNGQRSPATRVRPWPVTVTATAAVAALVTVAVTYLSGGTLPGFTAGTQARSQGHGALATCATHYAARERPNGAFTASLTVTNTGGSALEGWSLTFVLPAGQRLTSVDGARWTSTGGQVTLHGDGVVAAGRAAQVSLAGTFVNGDDAPTGFALDGVGCQQVSAIVRTAGTPGRQAKGTPTGPDRGSGTPVPEPPSPAASSTGVPPAASSTGVPPTPAASASAAPAAGVHPSPSAEPSASGDPSSSGDPSIDVGPLLTVSARPSPSASATPTP